MSYTYESDIWSSHVSRHIIGGGGVSGSDGGGGEGKAANCRLARFDKAGHGEVLAMDVLR